MSRATTEPDTAQRILETAQRLVQTSGYNAFSYADIADAIKITKASLHYHFPTKADLGRHLIQNYRRLFLQALAEIDKTATPAGEKLKRYAGLYQKVLRDDRLCLCGILAAEVATLPKVMRSELLQFFDENETWLAGVLAGGRAAKELHFASSPEDVARYLIGSLEGAMVLARCYNSVARFDAAVGILLTNLGITRA